MGIPIPPSVSAYISFGDYPSLAGNVVDYPITQPTLMEVKLLTKLIKASRAPQATKDDAHEWSLAVGTASGEEK